ncbi:type IV pilus biogenesis protein PilM [Yersinia pseudotuberculosis]|uniref:type IV pilus biogenesis protein PilM n=1 Tax=Yersinia pseudotuberculosis TaxID=633 RepID=UPI001A9E8C87|nr:pilus assembly protein PilM [Yersinia pseudotuberculosis]MBO1550437.1 pilus assembly protein HofM [Yersinia pseudotuberculosis]MBO1570453.1 pilus assembly protein HofM [Yersinia pseudotuberculosis]MBO1585560.1 pilus assembly protein HofM [Yersinia pseudotuberculosis]MBO1634883.1 pilus assembly protein HofM [Yersinia pseudotuberculosis]
MYSQYWQVGLDIQMEAIRALAVIRRRNGWQLRYWWHQVLPSGVLREGILHQPDILSEQLKLLRKQLPRHISLRIALPAQRILQHTIHVPDRRLREPERDGFIKASASRLFPVNSQALALDYCRETVASSELLITAARQSEVQQWQACLEQAGLSSQVIDIAPCALRYMATAAGLSGPYWLVHRLANEWLWVSSSDMPFHSGVVAIDAECRTQENDIRSLSALLAQLNMRCAGEDGAPLAVYYSSVVKESLPENTRSWSPLTAFAHYQPPLPALPAAFTLAGGLAVRAADSLSAAGAGY